MEMKIEKRQLLRNNEYYGIQEKLDNLYIDSKNNNKFKARSKNNKGSMTKGTNNTTIEQIAEMSPKEVIDYVRNRISSYIPHSVRRVEIDKENGGIISTILSNVTLNEFDWWISNQWETFTSKYKYSGHNMQRALKKTKLKEIFLVRYADDFKVFCKDYKTAQKVFVAVKEWLTKRLNLEISKEKSKVINLRKNFSNFLGLKLKVINKNYKRVAISHTNEKATKKIIVKIKERIIEQNQYEEAQG